MIYDFEYAIKRWFCTIYNNEKCSSWRMIMKIRKCTVCGREFEFHNAITDGHKNLGRNNNEEN